MNEWHKESDELVYDGILKVVRRVYSRPDGHKKIFDVKAEGDVACIFPVTAEGKVVLVRLFRPGLERYFVELPGGGLDKGDTPEVAAARELKEETGYIAEQLISLGTSYSCPYSTKIKHNFLALNCVLVPGSEIDFEEQTEALEMPLAEFRERLLKGEFFESDTGFRALAYLDANALV